MLSLIAISAFAESRAAWAFSLECSLLCSASARAASTSADRALASRPIAEASRMRWAWMRLSSASWRSLASFSCWDLAFTSSRALLLRRREET